MPPYRMPVDDTKNRLAIVPPPPRLPKRIAADRQKLTPQLIETLTRAMDAGPMSLEDAARVVGLSPRTVKYWLNEADSPECTDELVIDLAEAVARTYASGKRADLMATAFEVAQSGDTKMLSFLLERLMPSMNATKNVKLEAEVTAKAPQREDYSALTDDELQALMHIQNKLRRTE